MDGKIQVHAVKLAITLSTASNDVPKRPVPPLPAAARAASAAARVAMEAEDAEAACSLGSDLALLRRRSLKLCFRWFSTPV